MPLSLDPVTIVVGVDFDLLPAVVVIGAILVLAGVEVGGSKNRESLLGLGKAQTCAVSSA